MNKMKVVFVFSLAICAIVLAGFQCNQPAGQPMPISAKSLHDFKIAGLSGDSIDFNAYSGKYVLCVNVASKCGYTPQYKGLQELYTKFQDKLVIVGFPCNQFLGQEPGTPEEISDFCEKNYGVTFPLTEKIDVKGKNQHPIYQWLTSKSLNGMQDENVKWNFHKFLIGPDGKWLAAFPSNVEPDSPEIAKYLK
jgi:glutathione peroxidase